MAKLTRFVYPVFEVKSIDKWREFAAQMYGLPLQAAGDHYEMVIDESGCRVIFQEGKADDLVAIGWEADDPQALFTKLAEAGHDPVWSSDQDTASRQTSHMFVVRDPDGLPVEVFARSGSHCDFMPSSHDLDFNAGDLGVGHVTLMAKKYDEVEDFYREMMGFRVSDYIDWEVVKGYKLHIAFFHANARHHSMAVGRMPFFPKRIHHFMLEVSDRHQVGVSFDRIRKAKIKVKNEIGVHPNDRSFTFYVQNPSGFESELGAEALHVDANDPDRPVGQFHDLSIWGHKMSYLDALPLKVIGTALKWRDRKAGSL